MGQESSPSTGYDFPGVLSESPNSFFESCLLSPAEVSGVLREAIGLVFEGCVFSPADESVLLGVFGQLDELYISFMFAYSPYLIQLI